MIYTAHTGAELHVEMCGCVCVGWGGGLHRLSQNFDAKGANKFSPCLKFDFLFRLRKTPALNIHSECLRPNVTGVLRLQTSNEEFQKQERKL